MDAFFDYPLEDDQGNEIPVYTAAGNRIARRIASVDVNDPPFGGLMDLRHINELFSLPDDSEGRKPINYTVYPQAGLQRYGHFQADGVMANIIPLLEEINDQVQDEEPMEVNEGGRIFERRPPIIATSTQGYNSVMHFTRGKGAQHHDAQLGLVTAALAGTYSLTDATNRTAARKAADCDIDLPHNQFASKIDVDDVDRQLRLENTYSIDLRGLRPELRNGECVNRDPFVLFKQTK